MIFLETSAKEAINIDDVIQNITNIKAFYKSAEVILK
jgi:hypothetical protein